MSIGGSPQYFGAISYTSKSILSVGGDLSSVCALGGSEMYVRMNPLVSGEVMVFPPDMDLISPMIKGLSGVCIGPGLGRDPAIRDTLTQVCTAVRSAPGQGGGIPVVIDADGLYPNPTSYVLDSLLPCDNDVVITPNVVEFERLWKAYLPAMESGALGGGVDEKGKRGVALVQKLNITACVIKGQEDVICTNEGYITCEVQGGYKRPGGIGDVLAGVMTAFLGWAGKAKGGEGGGEERPVAETIWGACAVVREATRRAYGINKRSMSAGDVICELDGVVEDADPLFGGDEDQSNL